MAQTAQAEIREDGCGERRHYGPMAASFGTS